MTEFLTEFSLRDWLLVLGPVFIVGILLHGYWRMRQSRNSLRMSLDKTFVSEVGDRLDEPDELSMLRAELPNGGARVRTISEQANLDLDSLQLKEKVPVLMDTVDSPVHSEPVEQAPVKADSARVSASRAAPADIESTPAIRAEPTPAAKPAAEGVSREKSASAAAEQESKLEPKSKAALPANLPEKYVVLNVMAIAEPFEGDALLDCLSEHDMHHGEMNIFHRFDAEEKTLFSLMNAVEPGSFDLSNMATMSTPALSMFMRVHELHDPCTVFEQMLDVAQGLVESLGGELRDETRSVMTTQTIQHCQQELQEYKLKNHH